MSAQDIMILLPFLVVGGAAILVLLAAAFIRQHGLTAVLTLAGFAGGLVSLAVSAAAVPHAVA
ncbi:MAG TPA: hypothetical protein VMM82_12425, partial [Spirochaetia bacterium]|nr:hypothetical protein [Spirochaetia bacterium]